MEKIEMKPGDSIKMLKCNTQKKTVKKITQSVKM